MRLVKCLKSIYEQRNAQQTPYFTMEVKEFVKSISPLQLAASSGDKNVHSFVYLAEKKGKKLKILLEFMYG